MEIGLNDDTILYLGPIRIRQENDHNYFVINFRYRSMYVVNESMIEIISMCDGNKTILEIVEKYAEKFLDTDKNIIAKDIKLSLTNLLQYKVVLIKEGWVDNK